MLTHTAASPEMDQATTAFIVKLPSTHPTKRFFEVSNRLLAAQTLKIASTHPKKD